MWLSAATQDAATALVGLPRPRRRLAGREASRSGPRSRLGCAILAGLFASAVLPGPASLAETSSGLQYFGSGQYAEALHAWRDAAAAGDASAALLVGAMYDTGQGVQQDYVQALDWYRRAADGGDAVAMFNVGVMHDAGYGTPRNAQEAARWYELAAARRFGRAEYALALMYESGSGVTRDRSRAGQLFRAAAQDGVAAARSHLALSHSALFGDRPVGTRHAQVDIALRAFQQAQQTLRSHGPAESGRAVALFRLAAHAGNPMAQYDLGYCYENGIGMPSDQLQAYVWYQRAASEAKTDDVKAIATSATRNLEARLDQAQLGQARQLLAIVP